MKYFPTIYSFNNVHFFCYVKFGLPSLKSSVFVLKMSSRFSDQMTTYDKIELTERHHKNDLNKFFSDNAHFNF